MKSTLKQFWTSQKWTSLLKTFSQIGELITNQKNKKIQEIQIQREQNKAFIAYEKISKTIESVVHEEHVQNCYKMLNIFWAKYQNKELDSKLHRELTLKIKSLNQSI